MLCKFNGEIMDFDLPLLVDLLGVLESHISKLEGMCEEPSQLDQFGYIDHMEHVAGIGFVACQTYMTSIFGKVGMKKERALSLGPKYKDKHSVAQIVNHAANYWKHRESWVLNPGTNWEMKIREDFKAVGLSVDIDYPCASYLFRPHCNACSYSDSAII